MFTKRTFGFVLIVVLVLLVTTACASPNPTVETFVPLPPPVDAKYPLSLTYMQVGGSQIMDLVSPDIDIRYRQNDSQSGTGQTASELVELNGQKAVMQQVAWGDLWQGKLSRTEYYATTPTKCLIAGFMLLDVKSGSILQWFTGLSNIRYEIDRSRLYLLYVAPKPCERPLLTQVIYAEAWLGTEKQPLLMGSTAAWGQANLAFLPQNFQRWGFWESHSRPFDQATAALAATRDGLSQKPDYLAVNMHHPVELFGRREAFVVRRNGLDVGTITFDYRNGWGRGPNQAWIGNGAASRIEWRIDNQYFALVNLTPALPIGGVPPSTLAVFVDDEQTANWLETQADWVPLYDQLRRSDNKHVILAVHMIGDLQNVTKSVTVTGSDGKSATGSVNVGVSGGVTYSTLGNPSNADVTFAHDMLSALGYNGIKPLGIHFPSNPGSGNGLNYYVSILRLITAPEKDALNTYGFDVGVIDRVGFPNLKPLCWKDCPK